MVDDSIKTNEEEQKQAWETYSGAVSNHFQKIAKTINDWSKNRSIRLIPEFWFLFALIAFITINLVFQKFSMWLFAGIIVLCLYDLFYPNLGWVRKNIFRNRANELDKLLKKNNQDALVDLKNFISYEKNVTVSELNKIFTNRFDDNYEAYDIIFSGTKFSEDELKWFLEKDFINKDFVDNHLLLKALKSFRINIGFDTYNSIKQQLKKKNTNKQITKYFNYKYIRYTKVNAHFKNAVYGQEMWYPKVKTFFVTIILLTIVCAYLGSVTISLFSNAKTINTNPLLMPILYYPFVISAIGLGVTIVLNAVIRSIFKLFISKRI